MTTQLCVANVYIRFRNDEPELAGYSFYGQPGSKVNGEWTRDEYDTSLTTMINPIGEMQCSWIDPLNGKNHVIDMSDIDVPTWLADTKVNGKALDKNRPMEIYSAPRIIGDYSVKLIWNKQMSNLLEYNAKNPKSQKELPSERDQWTVRFLCNISKGILVEGTSFPKKKGWF